MSVKTKPRPKKEEMTISDKDVAIEIVGMHKWFGEFHVLKDINLQVMQGERIVICGPSGSGKSTLIRCINRLEEHQKGDVIVDGTVLTDDLKKIDEVRREVGMVFQHFNLFPHMTAAENVAEGLVTVRGMPAGEARQRALAELKRVGLKDKTDTYPSRLSGGQKQRVAIARALAMDPETLLFDEPTSALDPALVGEVLGVIEQLANEGRTMLLVTHEIGFAYHVSTRVVFLGEGGIYETGTPDEVLKHPKRPLTQQFLAEHNRFQF